MISGEFAGLRPPAHIHCMGIGGYGINPIARVMFEMGYVITGCDLAASPLLEELHEDVIVALGHSPAHVERFQPDALLISSAIPEDNKEILAAHELGVPVYKRTDLLRLLMANRTGVAIAGTHGKTTTTAMVAHALTHVGLDPGFIIGGVSQDLGTNARAGTGDPFVVEADEYDNMFLGLRPRIAVITSLELDHPDMFDSIKEVRASFDEFIKLLPEDGLLIANVDSPSMAELAEEWRDLRRVVTYGLQPAGWQATNLRPKPNGGMAFEATRRVETPTGELWTETWPGVIQIPGRHNVQNALAALAVGAELGVDPNAMLDALAAFSGTARRFEIKAEVADIVVIDDYAHHPTAIRATLDAARERFERRPIWAVWQPHTFRRTAVLLEDFATSFDLADHVVIMDVFRSRDTDTFGISPHSVLDHMRDHPDARHIPGLEAVTDYLLQNVKPGAVVIVMSAGDATKVADDFSARLGGTFLL